MARDGSSCYELLGRLPSGFFLQATFVLVLRLEDSRTVKVKTLHQDIEASGGSWISRASSILDELSRRKVALLPSFSYRVGKRECRLRICLTNLGNPIPRNAHSTVGSVGVLHGAPLQPSALQNFSAPLPPVDIPASRLAHPTPRYQGANSVRLIHNNATVSTPFPIVCACFAGASKIIILLTAVLFSPPLLKAGRHLSRLSETRLPPR